MEVDQLVAQINGSVESLRTLFTEIYPPSLDAGSFVHSLEELADRLRARDIAVHVDCPEVVEAGIEQLKVAYRVAQEATRNVVRHADANHVWIRVTVAAGGTLGMSVHDDGRGFALGADGPPRRPGHFGMRMLRDLVEASGGAVTITSAPGDGTSVSALVPM